MARTRRRGLSAESTLDEVVFGGGGEEEASQFVLVQVAARGENRAVLQSARGNAHRWVFAAVVPAALGSFVGGTGFQQLTHMTLSLELPFHYGLSQGDDDGRSLDGALLLQKSSKSIWLKTLRVAAAGADFLDVKIDVTRDEVRITHLPVLDLRFSTR